MSVPNTASPSIAPKYGRPEMPAGYGIAQTDKGLMTWEWVTAQIEKSRNYWICSTRPDGRPHCAPVWGVWLDGALYFSSDRQSRKARNLAVNPYVVAHLESGDDTVILEGTVNECKDQALLRLMVEVYGAKYPPFKPDPAAPGNVYYELKPSVVLAWLEKDFPNTATRWQFER